MYIKTENLNPAFKDFYLSKNKNQHIAVQKKQNNPNSASNAKKAADAGATLLWLTIVGFFAYKTGLFNKKSPESMINKAKKLESKYGELEKMSKVDQKVDYNNLLKDKNFIQKFYVKTICKFGEHFQRTKTKLGSELYNNLINSIGKLCIMPLVIFIIPFGEKETSNSDKISITIREPLSVIATFTLQAAFDKMFNIYMPKILKKNIFETEEIQKDFRENGKISYKNFEKIKYNPQETKRIFTELTEISQNEGGLKGILTKEKAKKILTLNDFDTEGYDSYLRAFEREVENGTIPKDKLELVRRKFKVVADSVGHYELAKIKPKIAMNIVAVVLISRIFLNVIHGKAMKFLNLKEDKNEIKSS